MKNPLGGTVVLLAAWLVATSSCGGGDASGGAGAGTGAGSAQAGSGGASATGSSSASGTGGSGGAPDAEAVARVTGWVNQLPYGQQDLTPAQHAEVVDA